MAKRSRAAVHIDLVVRDAKIVHCEHGDAGKGLVDFEQIDIADRPSGLGQTFVDRADGGGGKRRRFLCMCSVGNDACYRR